MQVSYPSRVECTGKDGSSTAIDRTTPGVAASDTKSELCFRSNVLPRENITNGQDEALRAKVALQNGGDVHVCPQNMAYRAVTLEQIELSMQTQKEMEQVLVFNYINQRDATQQRHATHPAKFNNDPPAHDIDANWKPPQRGAKWQAGDIVQMLLRKNRDKATIPREYAAERWGVRELIYDLYTAPFTFPWASQLIPQTPSARKLYAKVLGQDFQFSVPTSSTQWVLNRNEYFRLIFEEVLPSFPDLSFNVECPASSFNVDHGGSVQYRIQVTGTHTGKPFGFGKLPKIATSGVRVSLPVETILCTIHDWKISKIMGASCTEDPSGFPSGLYLQLGGQIDSTSSS